MNMKKSLGFIEGLDTIKKLGLKTPNWIEKIEGNIDFNFYGLKQGKRKRKIKETLLLKLT